MKTDSLHTGQDTPESLWELIGESVAILWKDWPKDMRVSRFGKTEDSGRYFTLTGQCPHCLRDAVFIQVTSGAEDDGPLVGTPRWIAALQCQGCNKHILGIVIYDPRHYRSSEDITYEVHYPLGKPNETLEAGIPKDVADDFTEAIRCQWIKAFRACVVMCGRAIDTSAIALGAKGASLLERIDDLEVKRMIPQSLKEFAHEVRLARNLGAHPDKAGNVDEQDADDIMAFTRQFLEYVYVMPEKLKARKAASPTKTTP